MELNSNYSTTNLFISKEVKISIDKTYAFSIQLKPAKDFYTDDKWNAIYHMLTMDRLQWKETLKNQIDYDEQLYYIQTMTFQLGAYRQYAEIVEHIHHYIQEIIPGLEISFETKEWIINDVTITPEIWNYVVYLLKLSCGEKVQKPHIFSSPEEKAFFLKQEEMEARIRRVKQKGQDGNIDRDGLMKNLLSITYSFPSLTFDYLFDQTMAQIHWLAKYAAQEVSYRVSAQACAAGNMKKGSKLEFFIK